MPERASWAYEIDLGISILPIYIASALENVRQMCHAVRLGDS